MDAQSLARQLKQIDGKGYKAYKSIAGNYTFNDFELLIDHVQADPFAAPSRFRAIVDYDTAALPEAAFASEPRRRAARDFIARIFRHGARREKAITIDAGHQSVLERTAVLFTDQGVELRFTVHLPGRGRSIMGHQARELICEHLPEIIRAATFARELDLAALESHMATVEDQVTLRGALAERGLVGFIAEGAKLPRRSGVDDRGLEQAIPFRTPESLAVTINTPNGGPREGLGIPKGITLIVGGGFHGKSTVLSALTLGVYDHIPGDGREGVVTDPSAMKIRAEDGRSVHRVDLSPYINRLPYGKTTEAFSTELASGSTSQAAALQESLESGARTILVDEDTSATNFMIRDRRMQALVAREHEPITPFVDRIRQLRDELAVSTVLVMGGSGDYFDCADTVIQMQDYLAHDVTTEARHIAEQYRTGRSEEAMDSLTKPNPRALSSGRLNPETKPGKRKVQARGEDTLIFGRSDVDLRAVEQIADSSQVRAIGLLLARLAEGSGRLDNPIEDIEKLLANSPWDDIPFRPDGDLALPRAAEVMAALNRLRGVHFQG